MVVPPKPLLPVTRRIVKTDRWRRRDRVIWWAPDQPVQELLVGQQGGSTKLALRAQALA